MAGSNEIIDRDSAGALVPEAIAAAVIKEAPKQSAALSLMRRVPMSTKKSRQPVLSALPEAYWVNGDTGLKQTTKEQWENLYITAEELAAIVVIPDALFDDASVPLWDEVQPYLIQALGKKVDQAALFGVDAPDSWGTPVVNGAYAAGNHVTLGTGRDIGVDVASLGEQVATDGFAINGFAVRPGLQWSLRGVRDDNGQPIYQSDGQGALYGYPSVEVQNGAWDPSRAQLIGADWTKFVIGVRQDITFKIFDSGVISDDQGKVIVNLMQQDAKALRVVFRVGYVTANPLTALGSRDTTFPAGVLTTAAHS